MAGKQNHPFVCFSVKGYMVLVWFRRDLRLADNPALAAAVRSDSILPVYVLDQRDEFLIGGASKWWLHHSLQRLNESLEGKLQFFRGDASRLIPELAGISGA